MKLHTNFLHFLGRILESDSEEKRLAALHHSLRQQLPGIIADRDFNLEKAVEMNRKGHVVSALKFQNAAESASKRLMIIESELESIELKNSPLGIGA